MPAQEEVVVRLRMQGGKVFSAEAQSASKSVKGIGDAAEKSSSRTSSAMSKLAGPLKAASLGLAAAGTAAAVMGVKYDMGMEQSRVAFTQFLGTGAKADAMISDLQKLNRATPFEFPELADTTKRLLAMGFSAEDAKDQTASLADAVAGIGGGGAELGRASLAIGQISSKGRLMAEDLMQLTELGIVGQQDLAKQLGMTGEEFTKAMSKGKISSQEGLKAITAVTKSNFGGAAAKQSKTFAGQLSNLKDSASMLLGEAMLPLFAFLRDEALPALSDAMPAIKRVATVLGKDLVVAIQAVIAAVKFLIQNWNTVKTVLLVLAPLFAAWATYATIMGAMTLATNLLAGAWAAFNAIMALNPIVLIIAALVALAVGLVIAYKKVAWFRNAVDAAFAAVKGAVLAIYNWVRQNWPKLAMILAGPFGIAVGLIVKHWDRIKSTAGALVGWFKGLGGKLIHALVDGITAAPGIVLDALKSLLPGGKAGAILGKALDVVPHALGGVTRAGEVSLVGERGPELLTLPGGSRITPLPVPALAAAAAGGRGPIHVYVQVDRRTIATATAQDTADQKARR